VSGLLTAGSRLGPCENVATGARQPCLELTPPDPAGVPILSPVYLSADGRSHVCSYRRVLDDLYVVDGLR
jgi:hypothetical protein